MRTSLKHWLRLCTAFPEVQDAGAWHMWLVAAYSEPQRAYHSLQHLDECLVFCDEARQAGFLHAPDELELALWLHDAVYDPRGGDNEEQSAALAAEMLGDTPQARRVADLVMLTKKHQSGPGPDDAWMIDIDLSIFAQPLPRVLEYERQIRQEYARVPEDVYATKRREILAGFLARPRIYLTDFFHHRHEPQARRHLHVLTGQRGWPGSA
ncbi:MAG: N-methyl-D-aspartate receptor NMDAR2C subunit [Prosthecobacter sp.]